MLIFGHNIEELLVDVLALATGVVPLNPGVVPVGIDGLAGHINLAVLHGEKGSIAAKAHLSMGKSIKICRDNSFLRYSHSGPDESAL